MSLLEGRRAVVTGAGDIGSVVARRLSDHGATVEVWDSSAAALARVGADGIGVREVDVTDRGSVAAAAGDAAADAPVNVLANTAAVARFGSVADLDPDRWQETLDVNLTGVYLCCRAFVGLMAATGGGSIVNISSIGGLKGEPDFASYCASKFGVIGLTQSLAREVGSFGIRVNAVCPGAVESQMNTETMARDARRYGITVTDVEQRILTRTALGRLVQPSDVADAVVFLASDLSSCITAESLAVTGTGVFEIGPCHFLAEDVFVSGNGMAFNDEGLEQMKPVIARSAGLDVEDMTFLHIEFPGSKYYDAPSGVGHHPDLYIAPLDLRKVVTYSPGLDFTTLEWLRKRGYTIVEVEHSEQAQYAPANILPLEPGLVVMHAEAAQSIANVRAAGVEVVEVPYSEFMKEGGGLHCSTGQVWREKGPYSSD